MFSLIHLGFTKLFEDIVLVLTVCLYHYMHLFIFITFIKHSVSHEAPCFCYILLCFSRARLVNSLVSTDTASSVTPETETSCQGTVARVTRPSAMESEITGIPLVSGDLVFLSHFRMYIHFTLQKKANFQQVFKKVIIHVFTN